MAIDHFGVTSRVSLGKAVEEGVLDWAASCRLTRAVVSLVRHPVGATGTRQALEAFNRPTAKLVSIRLKTLRNCYAKHW